MRDLDQTANVAQVGKPVSDDQEMLGRIGVLEFLSYGVVGIFIGGIVIVVGLGLTGGLPALGWKEATAGCLWALGIATFWWFVLARPLRLLRRRYRAAPNIASVE